MQQTAARLKGARISAQKARLVADQIRGKSVEEALNLLESFEDYTAFPSKEDFELLWRLGPYPSTGQAG